MRRQFLFLALRSRASLRAEGERIAAAEALKKQAALRPNPEFQFQNENLRPGQTYGRDVDTLAMINQPLDVLGKRRQRIALASDGVNRTRVEYELARWQIAQSVKLAYWTAGGAQEVREVLKSTVENFQKVIAYHAAQLSAGAIAEQDLLRVRLEGERLKISANLAGIEANRTRIELLKQMGQTDFAEVVLTEPLSLDAGIMPVGVEQALAQRLEIRVARAALEQTKTNGKLQEVSARLDLNVTYGYKRTQLPEPSRVSTQAPPRRQTGRSSTARQCTTLGDARLGVAVGAGRERNRPESFLAPAAVVFRPTASPIIITYVQRKAEIRRT